jgi:transposase-like protein
VAVWLVVNCKNGISSYEIMRDLNVTQKTAWFMLHRIRAALQDGTFEMMGGPVEVDEAYIGGAPKNKHLSQRMKTARTVKNAQGQWVYNPEFREARRVRAQVIPEIERKVLQDLILDNVSKGSKVFTDGLPEYKNLNAMGFVHDTVNHISEYVRGEVHTNGIENFWSLLKRGLRGTYIAVEPFHLDRYIGEQVFRFNNRATKDNPLDDRDRFMLAVSQISGKRLTYAELTGKVGETAEPF